jgi:mono/diheme cytochrome c family protein
MAAWTRTPAKLRNPMLAALAATAGLLPLVSCNVAESAHDDTAAPEVEPDEIDEREVVVAETPPPAITGASLTVIDEATVVVTDPDRDRVVIVGPAEERKVKLPAGAQPWRAVLDGSRRVHVALRGLGAIASIDVDRVELLAIRPVCRTVRGIGLRAEPSPRIGVDPDETLVVACAGGEVVELSVDPTDDATEVLAHIDPDLRDVVVGADAQLSVTRFRSAEVLTLDDAGVVLGRTAPPPWSHQSGLGDDATMRVSTAWRTLAHPAGGWVMVHQGGSDTAIDPEEEPEDLPEEPAPPYGGGGGGSNTCDALVQGAITRVRDDGVLVSSGAIAGALLPVDAALHPSGDFVALAIAGRCETGCDTPQIIEVPLDALSVGVGLQSRPCTGGTPVFFAERGAQIVAVAYSPGGRLWALQREPSIIHLIDANDLQSVSLSDVSVEDTGHRMFHEAGRAGLACASCHPEGGDDGLTWNLPTPLHTPALYVELAGTEPLHWRGELHDFDALVHEVHERRMGESLQPDERIAAFEGWVMKLRTTAPREVDAQSEAGRELFTSYGCATCHQGIAMTNGQTVAIGSPTAVQVPTLRGVSLHPPYMHDGRDATLADAVRDMIAHSGVGTAPTDTDVDRLVAYLETL